MNETDALNVLGALGALPAAPLHEEWVAAYVSNFLKGLHLPIRVDDFGNIIATYRNGDATTPLAFVAHLDHPAIEITGVESSTRARAALLGGVPPSCFQRPVPVVLFSAGQTGAAMITGVEIDPQTKRVAALILETNQPAQPGDWGVFDLVGFQPEGAEIAMRAADDLAGVAAALLALQRIQEQGLRGSISGVFTRAEEVGLVGASLLADSAILPPETIVVSLECSRALPGAEPGRGPVIRVGDRTRAFHPEGEAILLTARETIANIPIQRQLMSGGTCEATAFGARGYRTTGIALPLMNYHNVGPGDTIVPERINRQDFLGEIDLLVAAAQVAPNPPVTESARRLEAMSERYRDRLRATAGAYQKLA